MKHGEANMDFIFPAFPGSGFWTGDRVNERHKKYSATCSALIVVVGCNAVSKACIFPRLVLKLHEPLPPPPTVVRIRGKASSPPSQPTSATFPTKKAAFTNWRSLSPSPALFAVRTGSKGRAAVAGPQPRKGRSEQTAGRRRAASSVTRSRPVRAEIFTRGSCARVRLRSGCVCSFFHR